MRAVTSGGRLAALVAAGLLGGCDRVVQFFPHMVCASNAECPEACLQGVCAEPSAESGPCDEPADCQTGLVCLEGTCRPEGGCASNAGCAGACIEGACAMPSGPDAACDEPDDCLPGLGCVQQRCVVDAPGTPTHVFRSVGPGSTAPLASGGANRLTVAGGLANFDSALPARVGVGDAIVYSPGGAGTGERLAYIAQRWSGTVYAVQAADGGPAPATSAEQEQWSVFRAYTSLYAAVHREDNPGLPAGLRGLEPSVDLVASNRAWNIACYADAPDGSGMLSAWDADWGTGPQNYLRIFAPSFPSEVGVSQRHAGAYDPTRYELVKTENVGGQILNLGVGYVRVEGLQISDWVTSSSDSALAISAGTREARISHNILRGNPANQQQAIGLLVNDIANGSIKAFDNVLYGFNHHCVYDNTQAGANVAVVLFNNTLGECGVGLAQVHPGFVVKNNVIVAGQACLRDLSGAGLGGDYNRCNLAEAMEGSSSRSSVSVSFVNAAAGDYHLSPSDAAAADQGADLSADPQLAFETDIDGAKRDPPWDVGADER